MASHDPTVTLVAGLPLMAVVVMMFFALAHRNYASMRDLAFHMLELDGGVVDVEFVMQAVFHITQDALAD